jgi:Family of unknown function (DUF6152)
MMRVSKVHLLVVLCGLFIVFAGQVQAHHSVAAEFDANHLVTVTGTLTRVDWILPHAWIFVDGKGEDGTVQHWGFQTPTAFRRQGASARGYFNIGDTLTVTACVARNGALKGYIAFIVLPDGRKLSMAGQL